jgi:hypothetical protein
VSAPFNKFNQFIEDLAKKVHNLNSDALKVLLTNSAVVATFAVKADVTEVGSGNGYTTGGNAATFTSGAQTSGIYKLVLVDPATWTCVTAPMGPFRYAVLYNSTPAAGPFIGYWDYGAAVTLQIGEPFTVDLDQAAGVLTLQ